VRPILEGIGKVFFLGERPGSGQLMKLANNMLSAAALAVTSEVMVMGVKGGLDPKVMLEVINSGTGRNSASVDKFPRAILPRTFDFGFAIGLIGCFNGLRTSGGADGVGRATTATVVTASITILIMDFFLTKLFLLAF